MIYSNSIGFYFINLYVSFISNLMMVWKTWTVSDNCAFCFRLLSKVTVYLCQGGFLSTVFAAIFDKKFYIIRKVLLSYAQAEKKYFTCDYFS